MITFKTLRQIQEEAGPTYFTCTHTVWWGTRWEHLRGGNGPPLNLFDSVNFQYDEPKAKAQFFDRAAIRAHTDAYGKYPVTAFAMAHNDNLKLILADPELYHAFTAEVTPQHPKHHKVWRTQREFGAKVAELVDAGRLPNLEET